MSVKLKIIPFLLTIPLLLVCLFPAMSIAHDKVVVIPFPMRGEDKIKMLPPDPVRPLASTSPLDRHYSTKAGIVTDLVTGLEWQQPPSLTRRNWIRAWSDCEHLDLDGYGWRLPEVSELMSIVDYGDSWPAINDNAFASNSLPHWTLTESYDSHHDMYTVDFSNGVVAIEKDIAKLLDYRCVRGSHATGPVLVDNNNGTVTDVVSGMIWQQGGDNVVRNWVEARSYCADLDLGNEVAWRMPEIKELASIVNYRERQPSIDTYKFPGTSVLSYWAYTGHESSYTLAWSVHFTEGTVEYPVDMISNYFYVRCVSRGL